MEITLKAYITNLGKYNEGNLVGKWVEFPIDEEDFFDVLTSIGIDGENYEEWFVTDYDTPVNVSGMLGEYPSFEELNELAEKLAEVDDLTALNNVLEVVNSLEEAIDGLADGTIHFYEGISDEDDLGRYFVDEVLGGPDQLSEDEQEQYFDYAMLGRELDMNSYEDDNGEPISAGEYLCGDEDASDEEIGETFVQEMGFDNVVNPEYYFDYEQFGRDLTFGNFTFTADGVVEVS